MVSYQQDEVQQIDIKYCTRIPIIRDPKNRMGKLWESPLLDRSHLGQVFWIDMLGMFFKLTFLTFFKGMTFSYIKSENQFE